MKTALELLGKEKYEYYKQLHFFDSSIVSGKIRYITMEEIYPDMRYNFASYYANHYYPSTSQSPKWVHAYNYIVSLSFADLIKEADELSRKEKKCRTCPIL